MVLRPAHQLELDRNANSPNCSFRNSEKVGPSNLYINMLCNSDACSSLRSPSSSLKHINRSPININKSKIIGHLPTIGVIWCLFPRTKDQICDAVLHGLISILSYYLCILSIEKPTGFLHPNPASYSACTHINIFDLFPSIPYYCKL